MNVILVGGGRALHYLGQAFRSKGHALTIINRDAAECARLAQRLDATVVCGDGTDPNILDEAGVRRAEVVLAATHGDPDNLVICRLAQTRFGVPRAVALVNDPDNQRIFRGLGIDAISTSLTVASLIEQRAAIDQVTDLIPAGDGKVTISEVALTGTSPAIGRPLAQVELPRNALVAVLMRHDETAIPRGDTVLQAGDRVLLVALEDARSTALGMLTGRGA